ncbi:MAG: thioredoxin domain-containing protein, partial [Planctomycetota bacterium]
MRSRIKSALQVVKSRRAFGLAFIAFTALIIAGGCASGPKSGPQPSPQPTVATNQQVAFIKDGTAMVSAASGTSITKSRQTPSVVYKDRLYFFCCQSHMREFCAKPEQYINEVKAPNGMDIRGVKPPETVAAAPTHSPPPDVNAVQEIAVGGSPVRGAEDAPVTIVEFADMQCPYCIREWPKLKQILDEYPGKVRL